MKKKKKPGASGEGLPFCSSITIKKWFYQTKTKKKKNKNKNKNKKETRVCFKTNR